MSSDSNDDRTTFRCCGSLFNTGGQRVNEIDLSTYRSPKTLADMTDTDWELAADALRKFEIERGIR
ncbi:hypothetical protein [Amycolatopsis sp. cmx-8-4]|uniref:hypothetical protein n=1 Tax=Amycolatopsis sp. cmx-8-4 TaxID=2790947 RepID=UPI00397D4910